MAFDLTQAFDQACPGVVLSRDIDTAIRALPGQPSSAAILAAVLPLIGGSLPAQPVVALPIDGNSAYGTVLTFAKGLKRFADSNPCGLDGWSIEQADDDWERG